MIVMNFLLFLFLVCLPLFFFLLTFRSYNIEYPQYKLYLLGLTMTLFFMSGNMIISSPNLDIHVIDDYEHIEFEIPGSRDPRTGSPVTLNFTYVEILAHGNGSVYGYVYHNDNRDHIVYEITETNSNFTYIFGLLYYGLGVLMLILLVGELFIFLDKMFRGRTH